MFMVEMLLNYSQNDGLGKKNQNIVTDAGFGSFTTAENVIKWVRNDNIFNANYSKTLYMAGIITKCSSS
jgi:hypothetical protein